MISSDVRSLLAKRRLRCTRQRVEIYRALASTRSHPTAEQLYCLVRQQSPGTSLATVYNTLDVLCASGLVRRIPTPAGVARFDADMSPHLHAVTEAGDVVDVPASIGDQIMADLPPRLQDRLEDSVGMPVRHMIIQFGLREQGQSVHAP